MRRTILRVWVLLAILATPILASCDSGGSSESDDPMDVEVTVTGTVTSDSEDPIEGASVEVTPADEGIILASPSTDSTGTYESTFTVSEENAPARLQLRFTAGGFMTEEVTVDFSSEIRLNVTLQEITPATTN